MSIGRCSRKNLSRIVLSSRNRTWFPIRWKKLQVYIFNCRWYNELNELNMYFHSTLYRGFHKSVTKFHRYRNKLVYSISNPILIDCIFFLSNDVDQYPLINSTVYRTETILWCNILRFLHLLAKYSKCYN